jgi:hypothetical protein
MTKVGANVGVKDGAVVDGVAVEGFEDGMTVGAGQSVGVGTAEAIAFKVGAKDGLFNFDGNDVG